MIGINEEEIQLLYKDFAEHKAKLVSLGAQTIEIRQLKDLENPLDGLVLPGGESTVQGKPLSDLGILEPLREKIQQDLPVLATCDGLILLAENVKIRKNVI